MRLGLLAVLCTIFQTSASADYIFPPLSSGEQCAPLAENEPKDHCGGDSPYDKTLLSDKDLANKSATELYLLRNLIFAYHCYKFKSEFLVGYATGKLGHRPDKYPNYCPRTTDIKLNQVEQANIAAIQRYESIARKKAEADAKPAAVNSEIKIEKDKEICVTSNLLENHQSLVCFNDTFVGIDWNYYSLDSSPAKIVDGDPSGKFHEIEVVNLGRDDYGFTRYHYDGENLIRLSCSEVILRGYKPNSIRGEERTVADTLTRFFALLNDGEFDGAAKLYGGDYHFAQYNQVAPPDDHAQLLRDACTGSLRCLKILRIVDVVRKDTSNYRVRFELADGSNAMQVCLGMQDRPGETIVTRSHPETLLRTINAQAI